MGEESIIKLCLTEGCLNIPFESRVLKVFDPRFYGFAQLDEFLGCQLFLLPVLLDRARQGVNKGDKQPACHLARN